MKFTVVCLLALFAVILARPNEEYTNKYDNIDINEILGNKRLLKNYIACLLDKGKCTREGSELKDHMADALETDCSKCTEVQRSWTDRVISHLLKHEQEAWRELQAKYDPTGRYTKAHEAKLRSLGA